MNSLGNSLSAQKTYYGLDLVKFIMAIFIVSIHAHPLTEISYNWNYALTQGIARIGVPFFFVTSGFLLFRKMKLDFLDKSRIKKYLIHIFRLYVVWTVIYLPIIVYTGIIKGKHGMLMGLLGVIRNTIMSGSYLQLWFLQALLVSAIIIVALLHFRVSIKKVFLLTGALYCVALLGEAYYAVFNYFFPEGTAMYKFWHILKMLFVTPRNGICFGALYFFMGAYLSSVKTDISMKKIKWGMLISFALLMVEVMGGSFIGLVRHSDVYIFLIPLTYYVFLYAKNMQLKDSPKWLYLRKQSMYIFYIHPWFLFILGIFFGKGKYSLVYIGSLAIFLATVALSIIFGHVVIKLSGKKKFAFLRYLA